MTVFFFLVETETTPQVVPLAVTCNVFARCFFVFSKKASFPQCELSKWFCEPE